MAIDTDEQKRQDERYNPSAQDARNRFGEDQREAFNRDFENRGVASQESIDKARQGFYKPNGTGDDTKDSARGAEKKAVGDTPVGKAAAAASVAGSPIAGAAVKLLGKIKTKQGSVLSGAIGLFLVLIIVGVAFFSASLGPIAFFTNVLDDLNDSVAAFDTRQGYLMRTKVSTDNVTKGCASKMSIRCKYRSLSNKDVLKLKDGGYEVEGRKIGNRTFPKAYKVNGESYNPKQFANLIQTDPVQRQNFRSVFNMRLLTTVSANFKSVLAKFGTSAKAAQVTGDNDKERFENLATGGDRPDIDADTKFVPVEGGDDENGPFKIEGDTSENPNTYSASERDNIKAQVSNIKNIGKTGIGSKFIRGVSVTGWADTACTFKSTIGITALSAKLFQKRHLIQAGIPIAALVFKIKNGDGTPEDAAAVGDYFSKPDVRKEIADVGKSVSDSASFQNGNGFEETDEIKMQENPYYGKNALDSNLTKLSLHGGEFDATPSSVKYSLSLTDSMLVSSLAGIAGTLDTISKIGGENDSCDVIQSWWGRGIGFVTGIFAAFGSGGTTVALNIGVMATVMVGTIILQQKLLDIVSGSPVPEDIADKPEDRAAIQWTAMAATMEESNKRNGLIPGSKPDVTAYLQNAQPILDDYIALEAKNTEWYDASSPYSLAGQLATKKDLYTPKDLTVASISSSIGSLVADAATSPFSSTTYAKDIDVERLEKCDDKAYEKAGPGGSGIAADVQCNIRYHMPGEDLRLDPDEVALYMEDNNYVAKDTTTGFPEGYTPPDAGGSEGFVQSLFSGAVNDFYNTRASQYRDDNGTNEYAIYLDYCVYRALPWGETYEEGGAFGNVDKEWVNGNNCMLKAGQKGSKGVTGDQVQKFRVYTVDQSVMGIHDEFIPEATTTGGANASIGGAANGQPKDTDRNGEGWELRDGVDYSAYPCAEGTTDTGIYKHPTRKFTIRRCDISNDDVASIISARTVAIIKKAKEEGVNLTVGSGFRTYEAQQRLYSLNCRAGSCSPPTARPGFSNHEQGIAIDFGLNGSSFCFPGGSTCAGNKGYDFMVKYGGDYGFLKLPTEAWHWGMTN